MITSIECSAQKQHDLDSLINKTYPQFNDLLFKASEESNDCLLDIYRNYLLQKAKSENNKLERARAYYYFITWEDFEKDLLYSDSIIEATLDSNHKKYPTNGYLIKASLYYYSGDYNNALDNFIVANKWAEEKKDRLHILETEQGIAAIKNIWGLHDEALEIYKSSYDDILLRPNYLEEHYDEYMTVANDLSLSYIRNKKPDSAIGIIDAAMQHAIKNQDSVTYFDLGRVQATANFYLKKYPQAQDSLIKYLDKHDAYELSHCYYMLGKIAQYKNEKYKTYDYFKKIDSLRQEHNDPFPELKEVYNELYKEAGKDQEIEKQLYFINKLIEVDSVLDLNYTNINNQMRKGYDIPKLKNEKQYLI